MCRLLLKTNIGKDETLFKYALNEMKEGGPDATHTMIEDGIAFGHNRLSIIDPRTISDQPMMIDGNIILFNGEIYNFQWLKKKYDLETRTNSDTEVVLMLYNKFKDLAFSMLDGEFAIVIYDGEEEKIKVCRDRLGVKPLYYSNEEDHLIVSSEIKGILPFIGDPELDTDGFDEWLCYGYTIDSTTMFEKVKKCLPGMLTTFDLEGNMEGSEELDLPPKDESIITDSLSAKVVRAIGKRMMSDVPVSCTLSGGLDSSIVAYIMSKISQVPINTYTIGFEGCENEFEQAKSVADLIKSNHTQIEIPISDVLKEIDDIIATMEEPVDRGSLVPTYFLAKAVKEKVTLIGEGADEVFGGYSRHKWLMDHPKAEFEEYFNSQLRSFPSTTEAYMFNNWEDLNSALKFDVETEIPNFHTVRIDKCFMHNGVEARVPFLDPEVTSTIDDLPFSEKQNPEKKTLREAFRGIIPDEILERPKKALKFPFDKVVILPEVEKVIRGISLMSDYFTNPTINLLYASVGKEKNAARDLWNIFLYKKWEEKYLA